MARHQATISWQADDKFRDGAYSRVHRWSFDGGATVLASPSPASVAPPRSDPAGVDPEEALVAAVSSCHMLWFLARAQAAGFDVVAYRDDAEGTLARDERGRIAMTRIELAPAIRFAEPPPSAAELAALHGEAHERCFIANSLRGEVVIVPPRGSRES